MLFDDDVPEDKGLFTFYREQAEREEEIKREKKLKKQMKRQMIESVNDETLVSYFRPPPPPPRKKSPIKISPAKDYDYRQRGNVPKERLVESVVDMAKQIEEEVDLEPDFLSARLRFRQPSFIEKTRKYRQKIAQINQSLEREPSSFQEEPIPGQIKIESYHKRNASEDILINRSKPAIHSNRGSVVELPQIKKSEMPYKPKKSIKSKLIQQALRLKDRNKIRHIREYLKVSPSPVEPLMEEGVDFRQQFQVDSKSFAIFQQHQQKIFRILKRFKKGF